MVIMNPETVDGFRVLSKAAHQENIYLLPIVLIAVMVVEITLEDAINAENISDEISVLAQM